MPNLSIIIPNLEIGGAEKNAVLIANEFISKGYAVDMVLMNARGDLIYKLDERVRIIDLKCASKIQIFSQLKSYLMTHQVDTILAFMFPVTLMTAWACKIYSPKTKIVLTERTSYSKEFFKKRNLNLFHKIACKILMNVTYPFANSVILVSQDALKELKKFLYIQNSKINYHVIYNPVDRAKNNHDAFPQDFLAWDKPDVFKILAVGRLRQEKNYPLLLRAFKIFIQTIDARLIILGDGPERSKLEEMIQQLDLKGKVFLPGKHIDPSVFYQRADLFTLSSSIEGFPNVLLEALSHGINIVSTDCPSGPREILEDGLFGRLVAIDNPKDFSEAMVTALKNPYPVEHLQARASCFSKEKTILQYQALLFEPSSVKEV